MKPSDPLPKAAKSAQRATAKAYTEIEAVRELTLDHAHEYPDRVVAGLLEIFTDVAALYALLHTDLKLTTQLLDVDLEALVQLKIQRLRKQRSGIRGTSRK